MIVDNLDFTVEQGDESRPERGLRDAGSLRDNATAAVERSSGQYRKGCRSVPCLLCSVSMVILQHPTESLATGDFAFGWTDTIVRFDQSIADALMVALGVVMLDVLLDGVTQ